MENVLYAFEGAPANLLATLADIARDFDESPRELVCVLGPQIDGVQWFTFRASPFGSGRALAADFFSESFTLAKRDITVFRRSLKTPDELTVDQYKNGLATLSISASNAEVALTFGKVPAKIKRAGDGEAFALAALGWSGPTPWNAFTDASPRIALRKAGKVIAKPKAETTSGALPTVKVIPPQGEPRYAQRRPYAIEKFAVVAPARSNAGKGGVDGKPSKVAPRRLDVRIGNSTSWVDLSATEVITGNIEIIDNYHPDGSYGIRAVDLGAVREWKYPGRLRIQNSSGRPSERVVGKHLERIADISVRRDVAIDLPVLRAMHHGSFDLGGVEIYELVLPALTTCKRIELRLPSSGAVFRAPNLAEGAIDLVFPYGRAKIVSLTVETALPATAFTIDGKTATPKELATLGVRGPTPRPTRPRTGRSRRVN